MHTCLCHFEQAVFRLLHSPHPPPGISVSPLAVQEGDPEGWWQESFKSHTDSKPHGPEAISFDLSFPEVQHVYGLPEHATSFALKPTVGELRVLFLSNSFRQRQHAGNPDALWVQHRLWPRILLYSSTIMCSELMQPV